MLKFHNEYVLSLIQWELSPFDMIVNMRNL